MEEPHSERPQLIFDDVAGLLLQGHRRIISSQELLGHQVGLSRRALMRHLQCVAEASLRLQRDVCGSVVRYCMQVQAAWRPVLFVHHCKHDETPIRIQGRFDSTDSNPQLCKVYMVENQWAALLQRRDPSSKSSSSESDFLLIRGATAAEARNAENSTAPTIAKMLSGCWCPPEETKSFQNLWRCAETDANGASLKSERLVGAWPHMSPWKMSHHQCAAHRAHSIATSLFDAKFSTEDVVSSCIRTLLVLQSAGSRQRFQDALQSYVDKHPITIKTNSPLSDAALSYRSTVTRLFGVSQERGRSRSTVDILTQRLFNADWREPGLGHICGPGCCASPLETAALMKKHLPLLARNLRVYPHRSAFAHA